MELLNFIVFWSSLKRGDIVYARAEGASLAAKARVDRLEPHRLQVSFVEGAAGVWVCKDAVSKRVVLPWRPEDLRDNLLIFRRRRGREEDYVDDLKVRRVLVQRLLRLLTLQGTWREHQGVEPLHRYYTCCEYWDDTAIEEMFPELEGVPAGLNIQDAPENPALHVVSETQVVDWLKEGKHDCELAQLLLNLWVETRSVVTHGATLQAFFQDLLRSFVQSDDESVLTHSEALLSSRLPIAWLASFYFTKLPCAVCGSGRRFS